MDTLVVLMWGFVVFCGVYVYYQFRKPKLKLPPGPKGYPVLGNFHLMTLPTGQLHIAFTQLSKQYGDIVSVRFFSTTVVVLNSAEVIREAFTKEPNASRLCHRPKSFYGKYAMFDYADVSLSGYDSEWNTRRKVSHKLLKAYGEGIQKIENVVQQELQVVVEQIDKMQGKPFDPSEIILDSLCNILLIMVRTRIACFLE